MVPGDGVNMDPRGAFSLTVESSFEFPFEVEKLAKFAFRAIISGFAQIFEELCRSLIAEMK